MTTITMIVMTLTANGMVTTKLSLLDRQRKRYRLRAARASDFVAFMTIAYGRCGTFTARCDRPAP
jgi:hypothetical protein